MSANRYIRFVEIVFRISGLKSQRIRHDLVNFENSGTIVCKSTILTEF